MFFFLDCSEFYLDNQCCFTGNSGPTSGTRTKQVAAVVLLFGRVPRKHALPACRRNVIIPCIACVRLTLWVCLRAFVCQCYWYDISTGVSPSDMAKLNGGGTLSSVANTRQCDRIPLP